MVGTKLKWVNSSTIYTIIEQFTDEFTLEWEREGEWVQDFWEIWEIEEMINSKEIIILTKIIEIW